MPGGTPRKAYEAFVEPLKLALSCVANAKITTSPGGKDVVAEDHSWTLNSDAGAVLRGGFILHARMKYRIIRDDREGMGPFRVTTSAYDYALHEAQTSTEVFASHWHPDSLHTTPHIHLGQPIVGGGLLDKKHHLDTPRMTFEQAIRWALEMGARPICDDWSDRLVLAEAPHVLYRTWHDQPRR